MAELWGEIPTKTDEVPFIDTKIYINSKPRDVYVLPPLQQSGGSSSPSKRLPPSRSHFQMDPVVLHTVELLQYEKSLNAKLEQLKDISAFGSEQQVTPLLPPPERNLQLSDSRTDVTVTKCVKNQPLKCATRNLESDFVRGVGGVPPPVFEDKVRHAALRRAVAALCAHAGFDTCTLSVLDTLTDTTHQFMTQMTQLLRAAVNDQLQKGTCGFKDPIERAFHEMSVGSPLVLHQYYQRKILNYHEQTEAKCRDLYKKYEKLRGNRKRHQSMTSGSEDESLMIRHPDGIDPEGLMMQDLGIDILESTVLLSEEEEKRRDSVLSIDSPPTSEASGSGMSNVVISPGEPSLGPASAFPPTSPLKPTPSKKRKR